MTDERAGDEPGSGDPGPSRERGQQRAADDRTGDIRIAAAAAADLVRRGEDRYRRDFALQLAAEAICNRIGDAATVLKRRHPEVLAATPRIDWQGLIGLRVVVAHRYHEVRHERLWAFFVDELPGIVATLDRYERGEEEDGSDEVS